MSHFSDVSFGCVLQGSGGRDWGIHGRQWRVVGGSEGVQPSSQNCTQGGGSPHGHQHARPGTYIHTWLRIPFFSSFELLMILSVNIFPTVRLINGTEIGIRVSQCFFLITGLLLSQVESICWALLKNLWCYPCREHSIHNLWLMSTSNPFMSHERLLVHSKVKRTRTLAVIEARQSQVNSQHLELVLSLVDRFLYVEAIVIRISFISSLELRTTLSGDYSQLWDSSKEITKGLGFHNDFFS